MAYEDADCKTSSSCEKGHGRIEERAAGVTNQLNQFIALKTQGIPESHNSNTGNTKAID